MSLRLGALFPTAPAEIAERPLAGLTADSREAKPGFAFVAISGSRLAGADFVGAALAAGAVAVIGEGERQADLPSDIAYLRVPDARAALAQAAARLHPGQPETIVAVTGTAGKSSVADFVRQIALHCGREAASLGTLGVVTKEGVRYGSLTTPDPIGLHRTLDALARDGITHLAMEASSHGLDQKRLDGVRLSAAAFTNLGRDHLDYHPTMEAYLAAKMRLFEALLPKGRPAVINRDGAYAREAEGVARACGHVVLGVGRDGDFLRLEDVRLDGFTQVVDIVHEGRRTTIRFPLVGAFQVENALVAAALCIATGEDPVRALGALEHLRGVPGRLDPVGEVGGALCLVDYAHKPDALEKVLATLRPLARNRLVCVVGCGGDRDRGKRPLMGRIAAEGADLAIVTDDNPRSEDPASIRAEVMAGIPAGTPGVVEIGDRAEAIRRAVAELKAGDVLVVAGKGHETGQIVGERTLPFSDHEAVRAAIAMVEGKAL